MFPEFLQPLLGVLSDHPYAFIFVALLFAGELVLLPSIYLAVTGRLQIESVFAVAVVARTGVPAGSVPSRSRMRR